MEDDKKKLEELSLDDITNDMDNIDPADVGGSSDRGTKIVDLDDIEIDWAKSRGKKE
ncbi:MAG: hypothetical protein OCD76_18380 [Reichenbachiella sp.]